MLWCRREMLRFMADLGAQAYKINWHVFQVLGGLDGWSLGVAGTRGLVRRTGPRSPQQEQTSP